MYNDHNTDVLSAFCLRGGAQWWGGGGGGKWAVLALFTGNELNCFCSTIALLQYFATGG